MEKKLSIVIRENADYSEVVDSIADGFQAAIIVGQSLADGFQLNDILVAVGQEPTIREIINDVPVFLAQFKELTPETALNAVVEARRRTEAQFGQLAGFPALVYDFLAETAKTYGFIKTTIEIGAERLEGWKSIGGPKEIEA